jgi:excisionase family DNA binding protein
MRVTGSCAGSGGAGQGRRPYPERSERVDGPVLLHARSGQPIKGWPGRRSVALRESKVNATRVIESFRHEKERNRLTCRPGNLCRKAEPDIQGDLFSLATKVWVATATSTATPVRHPQGMSDASRKQTGPRRAGNGAQQGQAPTIEDNGDLPRDRLTLSVPEVAVRLGISRGLAYELVARGELPSLRLGNRSSSLS